MTTAVQDRAFPSSSDGGLTELKNYIKVDPSNTADDYVLETALESAKEDADTYIGDPFEDADGNDQEIPKKVELGVLIWASVIAFREAPELASESARDTGENYRAPSEAQHEIRRKYWWDYRKIPGSESG